VEILYLRSILRGFHYRQARPTRLWEDNASAIAMSNNPVNPDKSRHVDTRWNFLRDMDKAKLIKLRKVPGTENIADALTKSLDGTTLSKHVETIMGVARERLMTRPIPDDKLAPALLPAHKHVEMQAGIRLPLQSFLKSMGWGHDADFDPAPFTRQLLVAAAA